MVQNLCISLSLVYAVFISEVTYSNVINNVKLSEFPLPSSFKELEAFLFQELYNTAQHTALGVSDRAERKTGAKKPKAVD